MFPLMIIFVPPSSGLKGEWQQLSRWPDRPGICQSERFWRQGKRWTGLKTKRTQIQTIESGSTWALLWKITTPPSSWPSVLLLIHLRTFYTTFSEPLHPGFGFWFWFLRVSVFCAAGTVTFHHEEFEVAAILWSLQIFHQRGIIPSLLFYSHINPE